MNAQDNGKSACVPFQAGRFTLRLNQDFFDFDAKTFKPTFDTNPRLAAIGGVAAGIKEML